MRCTSSAPPSTPGVTAWPTSWLTSRVTSQTCPFPTITFDFVYATEATIYASDLGACYTEVARVLKPGGVFGVYEWLMTREFDETNAVHVEIRQRIEPGNGVTNMLTIPQGLQLFAASGLELYHNEDMAERGPVDKK